MSRDTPPYNTSKKSYFLSFFVPFFSKKQTKRHVKKKKIYFYFKKIVSSRRHEKKNRRRRRRSRRKKFFDFFKATTQTNASLLHTQKEKKKKKKKRKTFAKRAQIRVPLPPHNHFCELDGRARIASSKGERFEPRENAEHTRRLEETREVSRPKNHQSHPSSRHFSKRRRRHQSVCNRKHL